MSRGCLPIFVKEMLCMKIAIIGYSGSGKSTMARALGQRYGCPVLHLDTVQFLPGWRERDRGEALAFVRDFMNRHDAWIIDGNYTAFERERRLREADQIVLFDFPRRTCLRQIIGRYRTWRGQTRPDLAPGCPEKIDWEFLSWVLWRGRTAKRRESLQSAARLYPQKTVVLRSRAQAERFLAALPIQPQ